MYQYHFSFFTSPNLFHYLPLSNVIGSREVNGILQYNGSRRRTHLVYPIPWNGLLPRALTDIFYLLGDPDNNYCIISDWISIAATRHWLLENRNQQSNTDNIDNIDNKNKMFSMLALASVNTSIIRDIMIPFLLSLLELVTIELIFAILRFFVDHIFIKRKSMLK